MNVAAKPPNPAFMRSARLLLDLHRLFVQAMENSPEADSIRDQMDEPWYAMTTDEQERVGGFSEDLYAVAEGGPPCVTMSEPELYAWKKELDERRTRYQAGDVDGWLAFLRKPRPSNFPPPDGIPLSVIRFFQAQCWENLGDLDTAAFFRKAAENLVMEQLTRVA
ncbi:MAG: hypothetical protein HY289_02205 [Planctomycetes bacterium]|nr:hypothetical protein [Planctomycetota bacterium]